MELRIASSRMNFLPRSLVESGGVEYGLAQEGQDIHLIILAMPGLPMLSDFAGEYNDFGDSTLFVGPQSYLNAASLRKNLVWLRPGLIGLQTSAGMGDRLGLATPGHVRAVRKVGGDLVPVFAQQSIREMKRTGRTPQQVLDDVTWGIFAEGWRGGTGADADHLKTLDDIDACWRAGFTFFTFDPGEFVLVDQPNSRAELTQQLEELPVDLQPQSTGLLGKTFEVDGKRISLTVDVLSYAVAKYSRAVAQVTKMYHHLQDLAGDQPFEVEVSMDETAVPTSPAEHIYISSELKRLGVRWVSFAPRFVGRFEKGVEYIGGLEAFKADVRMHAAIARQLGPYKLSLHSGSDKFSIYPIFMEETQGLAHLKTAGTSYLEALRTVAQLDREFFKEIYKFSIGRYDVDKLSYHVSAEVKRAPDLDSKADWGDLFEQFDAREILHVAFGSVLTHRNQDGSLRFYDRLMRLLKSNREKYFDNLEGHFKRHLQPFSVNPTLAKEAG